MRYIDETVEEARPASEAVPAEQLRGEFISLDHATRGVVRALERDDGSRLARLEGIETENGPDVSVYLSPNPAGGAEEAFDDVHANLGRLKGNRGDQNDSFNSAFGAADLTEVERRLGA